MKRMIASFHLDELGAWVADLDCGHGQHVRHRPPFVSRPWVTTDVGRKAMLGTELDCVRCDRMELPRSRGHIWAFVTSTEVSDRRWW